VSATADAPASVPRELMRTIWHHPRDLPERLVVLAVRRQGAPAKAWARERLAEGVDREEESDRLRKSTLIVSRVDGAVSGTPFFIALVPAYVAFLWAQAQMVLRIAALYGRDPTDPGIAAEVLALRGVYRSVPEAQAGLDHIGDRPEDQTRRDRFESWVDLVKRILVLAAFTSASNPNDKPGRARQAGVLVAAGGIWIVTCVFPVTFMVLMSWSCDTSTRKLGAIALEYYSGKAVHDPRGLKALRTRPDRHKGRKLLVRWTLLTVSVAIPIGLLAYTVAQRNAVSSTLTLLAAVIGLSIVLALTSLLRRFY
jgi:hypothetical protein